MKIRHLVTAVLVVGSASFGFLPLAHADSSQSVASGTEAWYQPNPTCQLPTGCEGVGSLPVAPPTQPPALTPFPARSMHVAVSAGQETARTYLSFNLPLFDGTLTGASLDVPLDTTQQDGSLNPEQSKIVVCTFQGLLTSADASVGTPPTAQCDQHAAAKYVATPTPHLHADLSTLVSNLANGAGVVLLPDAASTTQTDAWHVVFSAHDRSDAAKTPPATMNVTLAPLPVPPVAPQVNAPAPQVQTPVLAPAPLPPVPAQAVQPPTVPNQPAPVAAVPQARTITVGYAYPVVWLLPLAFLLIVPIVARSLTRDLTPARA